MTRFTSVVISALLSLLPGSCWKTPTGSSDGGQMRLRSFPNSVGSSWTYELTWRVTGKIDTVVVTVVARIDSSAVGPATVWVYKYPDRTDTQYVALAGDTLRYYYQLQPGWSGAAFVFPLYVGAVWKDVWWKDSTWVSARELVTVPAGHFRGAYRVEEQWGVLNSYGRVTTWIARDVGIVKEDRNEVFGLNYVRRLLSFEIAEDWT